MDWLSLLKSFDQGLPPITIVRPKKKPTQATESSATVQAEIPPRILITARGEDYIAAINTYLAIHASALAKEPASPPEPNRIVRNEADAVAHARTNLLNPIMRAIDLDPQLHGKVFTSSELALETLRVDVGISHKDKHGDKHGDGIVMMVEFKRAELINIRGFQAAMWRRSEVNKFAVPFKDDSRRYLLEATSELKLIKQAKAYAKRAQCLYIALCDYESLILLNFSKDLTIIEVTIVNKKNVTYLKALFGFLLTAIEHFQDMPNPSAK